MYYVLCVIMYEIYYGRCICVRATYYGTCTRAEIYIFNAPETDSAYIYTCKDIHYGLSFTLIYTCKDIHLLSYIHARTYITVYHLLFDFTKPYSGRPPHRANIGQA